MTDWTSSNGVTVECRRGDITAQPDIDVIVNAANAELRPGGGVAGAIHRAAGPGLYEECRPLAPIRPGEAVITGAHELPNQYVIHCLGPVHGRDEPADRLLSSCYRNALLLAEEKGSGSIAFPAISTGMFGYPVEAAARTRDRDGAADVAAPLRGSESPVRPAHGKRFASPRASAERADRRRSLTAPAARRRQVFLQSGTAYRRGGCDQRGARARLLRSGQRRGIRSALQGEALRRVPAASRRQRVSGDRRRSRARATHRAAAWRPRVGGCDTWRRCHVLFHTTEGGRRWRSMST